MSIHLKERIEAILGEQLIPENSSRGFLASTQIIKTASGSSLFLKVGKKSSRFRCEANGLKEIEKSKAIRTPRIFAAEENFLLTEYIPNNFGNTASFVLFGERLAEMHRFEEKKFGFYEDNFIGDNPQINTASEAEKGDWTSFYFNKRLLYQYKLAEKNGRLTKEIQSGFVKLENRIEKILKGSERAASLLHGDLWRGNCLYDLQGEVVLIDPACYYGNREADLAMTRLFGAFSPEFYSAYERSYPLADGWKEREGIYLLYHLLNHLNLFGNSYLGEVERIIKKYTI